jgi:hypothetical protein
MVHNGGFIMSNIVIDSSLPVSSEVDSPSNKKSKILVAASLQKLDELATALAQPISDTSEPTSLDKKASLAEVMVILQKFQTALSHDKDNDQNLQNDIQDHIVDLLKEACNEKVGLTTSNVDLTTSNSEVSNLAPQMRNTEGLTVKRELQLREIEEAIRKAMTPKKGPPKKANVVPTKPTSEKVASKN